MSTWLVTGGAGYIGSHVVRALRAHGHECLVFDDFSSGLERRVPEGVLIVRGSVHDRQALLTAMTAHDVHGVIHLAAKKAAGESVHMPEYYYAENVGGVITLLQAMAEAGVRNLVYSSSAAVYGTPAKNPVTEDSPLIPESPYGETKVIGEWQARDAGVAHGLSWVALRYFNVAGAADDELGDNSVNNLVPMVFAALERGDSPQIFGDDYPTRDGTCIRDYIHVADLAEAHVAAAERCTTGQRADVFNVGTGSGSTVREVMDAISAALGRDIAPVVVNRRAGDPPATWADTTLIGSELEWTSTRTLDQMVQSAWSAWRAHPAKP